MLLAAGRGERMRPLTDHTPKPLLPVQGRALLDWHIAALLRDGVAQVLVNTAWLGAHIAQHLDATWRGSPLQLRYSHEQDDFGHALETAGGIARALPQLPPVFWLAAGDVFVPDFVFDPAAHAAFAASDDLAHLWLVPNPAHNPRGDFGLAQGLALNDAPEKFTYSTMGLYRAALFAPPWCDLPAGNPAGVKAALAPLLRAAIARGRVSAELYTGAWTDVGTPARLQALNG